MNQNSTSKHKNTNSPEQGMHKIYQLHILMYHLITNLASGRFTLKTKVHFPEIPEKNDDKKHEIKHTNQELIALPDLPAIAGGRT